YDYYLELERANKPDFSMAFPRIYTIIREMIEGDKNLQIYLKKGKDGLLQRYPVGVKVKNHINEEWQVDSTKMDFMVKVPDENAPKGYVVKRKNLSAVIETYGGGAHAELVDTTNSNAQIEVLVHAMEKMGKPDRVRSDNGSDYASSHYQGFLARCGISSLRCSPYRGREKGQIERFFGVLHGWLYWIPGYIGNDVAKRQQIESQRASKQDTLSGKATRIPEDELLFDYDLQAIIDGLLAQRFSNYAPYLPHKLTNQELDEIKAHMGKRHRRTLSAEGIKLNNKIYTSAKLWEVFSINDGVIVAETPKPTEVEIYTPMGDFVCIAKSTELGAECMDLEQYQKVKKQYKKDKLSPLLNDINSAQKKTTKAKANKVKKALNKKSPPKKAPEKDLKVNFMHALEEIRNIWEIQKKRTG
ncbi:DDE-type integrase/transposase/recombinase, partial [Helicobacter suis]|uniref:DDE-type integrase/transposase/recombinase n=1 Tax=Helicobacter suis TaxID=104628 RepID=UPI0013D3F38F